MFDKGRLVNGNLSKVDLETWETINYWGLACGKCELNDVIITRKGEAKRVCLADELDCIEECIGLRGYWDYELEDKEEL